MDSTRLGLLADFQTFPQSVYAEQLMGFQRGYPILHPMNVKWIPPVLHHDELIRDGYMAHYTASLGDVGYIEDGKFMRLFNATRDPHDPINTMYGVPKHFEPLRLHAKHVLDQDLGSGRLFFSQEAPDIEDKLNELQHSNSRTALLWSPERVISRDYANLVAPQIEKYILENFHNWYHFANTHFDQETHGNKIRPFKRHLHLAHDALIFVTGVDLTAGWKSRLSAGENAFHREHDENIDHFGVVYEGDGDEDRRPVSQSREPQSIFIRGYKFCDFHTTTAEKWKHAMHTITDMIHHEAPITGRKVFHPADSILQEIHKRKNADVVLIHDDIWCHTNPDRCHRLAQNYTRKEIDAIVEGTAHAYFNDHTNQDIEFDWKGAHPRHLEEAHDDTKIKHYGDWHVPEPRTPAPKRPEMIILRGENDPAKEYHARRNQQKPHRVQEEELSIFKYPPVVGKYTSFNADLRQDYRHRDPHQREHHRQHEHQRQREYRDDRKHHEHHKGLAKGHGHNRLEEKGVSVRVELANIGWNDAPFPATPSLFKSPKPKQDYFERKVLPSPVMAQF